MNFFKNTLSAIVGTIIGIVIIVLFFIVISVSGDDKFEVDAASALMLQLDKPIVERTHDGEAGARIDIDFGPLMDAAPIGLKQIKAAINHAKNDEKIKGIFLNVSSIQASPSTAFDVRKALEDFKESGKWILAFAENYSQGGFYIASVADELYLYPEGGMDWQGIGGKNMFFKDMLDDLDIEMQIIRGPNNKFKSAVEPLMYNHMSEPSKLQTDALISDIWRIMLEDIASSRNLSVAQLNGFASNISIATANDALRLGMVDGLKYQDEVMAILQEKLGVKEVEMNGEREHLPSLGKYNTTFSSKEGDYSDGRIAVVYAVGGIESGKGDDETIGSETIAKALREARLDEKVKAVVLRVNSPGGSALASDVIWREMELIKEAGTPLVVSMGDVAASGGYYIACNADKIIANKNTITGSIGVFGVMPNLQKFYENKLGVKFDGVNSNGHNSWSINYPLDSIQKLAVEKSVTEIYDDFTAKVAAGRGMTQAEVDAVGQGRVWSGEDALEIGLVDEIGDLDYAINLASEMANLSGYKLKELPEMEDPMQKLIKQLTGQAAIENYLGPEAKKIMEMRKILEMKGVQARLPLIIEFN